MNIFVTSSPYLDGADRAILNPENHFVENLREVLPPFPRVLFVASDPERHDLTCSFGMNTAVAFCQAGMPFSAFQVLDGTNAEQAAELIRSYQGSSPRELAALLTAGMPSEDDKTALCLRLYPKPF